MPINEPPKLDPKTKEVWAGLRVITSMSSDLYTLVQDLRSRLSGYTGYKDVINGSSSFDDLESAIQSDYADLPDYSDADITATVDTLRNNFSWSGYKGDSSSGALGQSGYDSYRSFLLDNGVATVAADDHIRLLKDWYDPGWTVHTDRDQINSFSDWETYVSDAGMADDRAATFATKLESEFGDFSTFDSQALQADDPLTAILNQGSHNPESGDAGLGVKIWESPGTTPSGVSASPGDVSLRYGGRLYLEQAGGVVDTGDEGTADLSYGATNADTTSLTGESETAEVSATVENTGDGDASVNVPYVVNGETVGFVPVDVPAGESRTVSTTFGASGRQTGSYDVALGDGDPVTISILLGGVA